MFLWLDQDLRDGSMPISMKYRHLWIGAITAAAILVAAMSLYLGLEVVFKRTTFAKNSPSWVQSMPTMVLLRDDIYSVSFPVCKGDAIASVVVRSSVSKTYDDLSDASPTDRDELMSIKVDLSLGEVLDSPDLGRPVETEITGGRQPGVEIEIATRRGLVAVVRERYMYPSSESWIFGPSGSWAAVAGVDNEAVASGWCDRR